MILVKILECSTKGDKRFSALYAKVQVIVNGVKSFDSIEVHYQNSKEYLDEQGNFVKAKDWKEAKHWQHLGKKPIRMNINGKIFPLDFHSQYYKMLWVKYLDSNPDLVTFASQYDDFTDSFRRENTMNCQADVIRQFIKEGRNSVLSDCQPLILALKGDYVMEVIGDLLEAKEMVIGHQVNCLGVMGGGLAKLIKEKYPSVFNKYDALCKMAKIAENGRKLMGCCHMVEVREDVIIKDNVAKVYPVGDGELVRVVANLFGQYKIGTNQQRTEVSYLRKALEVMKKTSMEKGYSVALPYQLGCGLGGGEWAEILSTIKDVFDDYPVTIYRLPNV
ncbi:macro domain-containing protein (plasmid) [Paenibacillus thiaminolyticus]|uniref:DarT1-associated NADAR antitoxin family protein n=1 Tax=Paenibacillus thiaminolyticus TaxID=49283 RepID=UPI00232E385C|nr:macro domain-containing protein [Paenibacillus thiaminolyticus]WCF11687.1 macro domain-containing protein [Paenibacillus thiaminolyticus]